MWSIRRLVKLDIDQRAAPEIDAQRNAVPEQDGNKPATLKISEKPRKYHFLPSQSIFTSRNSSTDSLPSSAGPRLPRAFFQATDFSPPLNADSADISFAERYPLTDRKRLSPCLRLQDAHRRSRARRKPP